MSDEIEFKSIDPKTYVNWSEAQWAQKTAKVKAEFVPVGTIVETIMADGHVETSKTAGPDGGYKITNATGEQYLVDPAKFETRYKETVDAGVYAPKFDPVLVVQINESVSFKAPWGEDMRIKAGGVLVKAGENDVYGIQAEEYQATYSIISQPGATRPATMPRLDV